MTWLHKKCPAVSGSIINKFSDACAKFCLQYSHCKQRYVRVPNIAFFFGLYQES